MRLLGVALGARGCPGFEVLSPRIRRLRVKALELVLKTSSSRTPCGTYECEGFHVALGLQK